MHKNAFLRGALAFALMGGTPAMADELATCDSEPNSNVGCEFYAVTLPNAFLNQATFQFGLSLLNAGAAPVSVTISGGALVTPLAFQVPAGTSVLQTLPWVPALSTATGTLKLAGGAYHVVASGPLTVVQLNPTTAQIGEDFASSGDSSLLLPVASGGRTYRAVVWPSSDPGGGTTYAGNVAVVGLTDDTSVQVAIVGGLQPGAGLAATGGTVPLEAGDVLLMSSALDAPVGGTGSDLSGMLIQSSAPVLVQVGHAAANIPVITGFADHLEESLPPLSALSNQYLVTRPGNPSGAETGGRQYLKLVGTSAGTTLSYSPAPLGVPVSLEAGQSATFEATTDFRLTSNFALLIGQFMEGGQTTGFDGKGDPAQTIAVPLRDAQTSADFLAPVALAPRSVQLIAPTGAVVNVDGVAATGWTAIGSTGYSVANVALSNVDKHAAVGNQPFTLSVYAYPTFMGYWHPGRSGASNALFADSFE